ncbi:MAG: Ig-like domain repeat protein [Candidatus Riflebacteria bacterium]|nr:Ig-like domain repeat protein [Candidatus Riflebacteria bacterium]
MISHLRTMLCSIAIVFALFCFAGIAYAEPPVGVSAAVSVSNEVTKVDGKAAIGETLNFQVIFTSNEAAGTNAAWVDLGQVGGPLVTMTVVTTGQTAKADATWVVTGGSYNNLPFTPKFTLSNASGPVSFTPSGTSIYVDNVPPSRSSVMSASVDGTTYTGTPVKKGQSVNFMQGMSASDMGSASINLSTAGLSSVNAMPWVAPSYFMGIGFVFPDNLDTTCVFPVAINDSCGNPVNYGDFTMIFDTKPPSITAGTVVNQAGNTVPALPGHILNFSVTVAAYDGDSVVASQSVMQTAGISMPVLTPTSTPAAGSPCTFQGTLNLPKNTAIHGSNYPFEFIVTDNAGNVTKFSAYLTSIDLDPPAQTTAQIAVYKPSPENSPNASPWDTVASIGTRLVISSDITTSSGDTIVVTAKMSSIGGQASLSMTLVEGNTYMATYTIPQGSLENDTDYSFQVYAKDSSGNLVYMSTTPSVRVDNRPPSFSGTPSVTKSGGGSQFLLGDTVIISAVVDNVEASIGGKAWVDLSAFGLSATTEMTAVSGSNFTKSFTITTSTIIDNGGTNFKIYAKDDVGNTINTTSTSVGVDNEPPVLVSANYTVSPAQTASKPYVRIGDDLTLRVVLASTTGNVAYDGQTVFADLSSVGGSANQPLSLSAGVYTFVFKVTSGTITDSANFPLIISDNAGNGPARLPGYVAVSPSIPIAFFDNNPPDPGALTITGKDWQESLTVVNIGDVMNFRLPVTLDSPDDHADATIDLSNIGGSSTALMDYADSQYSLSFNATNTLSNLESASYNFKVKVYDKAGNIVEVSNGPHSVDCWPPRVMEVLVTPSTAVIGNTLSFQVRTAEEDGGSPLIDLSALGLSSAQALTPSPLDSHRWDYTVTVATGTLYNGTAAAFRASIKDNGGNSASALSSEVSLDNVPPKVSGPLSVSWSDVPADGKIKLGDQLTFMLPMNEDANQIGTAYIDLIPVGGAAAVAMVPPPFQTGNFSITFTAAQTTSEYTSYSFKTTVTDARGNVLTATSSAITEIDCVSPAFSGAGIIISKTNDDNPVSTVANIGDEIIVYTQISNSADTQATAAVFVGATQVATSSLVYNSLNNRFEAMFTIPENGGDWGSLDRSKITYYLTATDDAGNVATPASAASTFTVDNVRPIISASDWTLNPDAPEFSPVINLGSGSLKDLLHVSATLNEPVTKGVLKLSDYPGAPSSMSLSINGTTADAANISLSTYGEYDSRLATFTVYMYDQGGNYASTSKMFQIDTKRPQITAARFDGTIITLDFSETVRDIDISKIAIRGTDANGIATYTQLSSAIDVLVQNFTSCDITLALERRKAMAAWAAQPISLWVKTDTSAPYKDLSGNWGSAIDNYFISLTSTMWREAPVITSFLVTQTWPLNPSIKADFIFSKNIDSTTLVASNGVFFVQASDFTSVDYRRGYVLQPSDSLEWVDQKHLKITFGEDGGKWMARKLGSQTAVLRFASRTSASLILKDELGKPMAHIPSTSPVTATVARPYTVPPPPYGFAIESSTANRPVLNLSEGNGSLVFSTTDYALLYWSDFETNDQYVPLMGMPIPDQSKRVTAFHSKIQIHDASAVPATYVTLALEPLSIAANPLLATTSIKLSLTSGDLQKVLGLYRNNPTPNIKLRVLSGAFMNWWGQPNQAYEPSEAGYVSVVKNSPDACSLAACALSDPSPVSWHSAGDLTFEFEISPSMYSEAYMPIASITPRAKLLRQDNGAEVSSGTFIGWTTRQVTSENRPRYIARFRNSSPLPGNVQRIPSRAEIYDVTDAFGNKYDFTASTVYDLSARSTSGENGFSKAALTFVIDSYSPEVTAIEPSPGPTGQAAPGEMICRVTYSEEMDSVVSARPTLELATGTTKIPFTFQGWENSSQTARFVNSQAITTLTPNGFWTYKSTGGKDLAGNPLAVPAYFPLEIRTKSPAPSLLLFTRQPKIFNNVLQNRPFSTLVGDGSATLRLDYTASLDFIPHKLLVYNTTDQNVATFTVAGENPAFTGFPENNSYWAAGSFPQTDQGPYNYRFRVMDTLGNLSIGFVGSMTFDSKAPDVSSFTVTDGGGIATDTGDGNGWIRYHSPVLGNLVSSLQTNAADPLLLAAVPTGNTATEVYYLTPQIPATNHSTVINTSSWAEGTTIIAVADLAGNFGSGIQPSLKIKVDKVSPVVSSVTPSRPTGAIQAGKGAFEFSFSENMNTAIVPNVSLVFESTTIRLIATAPACWKSRTLCRMTNADPIIGLPVGTYTYQISGAKDFAGNSVLESNFQVWIHSQGTQATSRILTRQPRISSSVFVDSAFSPYIGESSATIELNYSTSSVENPPYKLLAYDSTGANVATFGVISGYPAISTFSIETKFWAPGKVPSVNQGGAQYTFKLQDCLGNISDSAVASLTYDSLPTRIDQVSFDDHSFGIASMGIRYYSPLLGAATVSIDSDSSDAHRMLIASNTLMFPSIIQMTANGNTHAATLDTSIQECIATITFADHAGNKGYGAGATMTLRVDRTSPVVTAASPSTRIGNANAEYVVFDITFSEPMQTASAPDVRLELGSSIIQLKPASASPWKNPFTCRLTNRDPINNVAIGTYTYMVWGGKDYAGNENLPSNHKLYVNASAPNAPFTLLSRQPAIFTDLLENQPFSTSVGDGSATMRFDISEESLGAAPHRVLVYDAAMTQIATLPVTVGSPGYAIFPGQSSSWASNKFPQNGTGPLGYNVKLIDALGNTSSIVLGNVVYDSKSAIISNFIFDDSERGLTVSGVKYYSPVLGSAKITVETNATDSQRLLIASSAAVFPEVRLFTSASTTHSLIITAPMADCIATFSVVDLAGNPAVGTKLRINVDGTQPRISAVYPTIPIGALAPETGTFEITFSEVMRTSAAPQASLRYGDYIITLKPLGNAPACWKDSRTCRFTNLEALSSFPAATYSYYVHSTPDLAGNLNEIPAAASFTLQINPVDAQYQVVLRTRQDTVSSTSLIDKPFSPYIPPFQGTLSFKKLNNSPNIADKLWVYAPGDIAIASTPLLFNGDMATITVNASFFRNPGETGPTVYSMKVQDKDGFFSQPVKHVTYDGLPPQVNSIDFTGLSDAATSAAFFNPLKRSELGISVKTQASDSLRLLLNAGTGTQSFNLDTTAFYYTGKIPAANFAEIPDGEAVITIADQAGNLARGTVPGRKIIIDRTVPSVSAFSSLPISPIRHTPPGQATFTVSFNEPMNQLASAAPTLVLSSGTSMITCRFMGWKTDRQAIFENKIMIAGDAPEGPWDARIQSYDLSDNRLDAVLASALSISARGPIIVNWRAESYQLTTASQPYPVGVLVNAPFSTAVWPNSATLNIDFQAAPNAPVRVHFTDNGVSVASGPLTISGTRGLFTWKTNTGPNPTEPKTYTIRLSDVFGNFSLETFEWIADSVAPVINSLSVTGGVVSPVDGAILFNPTIHTSVDSFWRISGETMPPLLRACSVAATSTLQMAQSGSSWVGRFNGMSAFGTVLPDAEYTLDIADAAGNIGLSATAASSSVKVILDTAAPVVATLTTSVGSTQTSRYAPVKGDLEISISTAETLSPDGIWKIDITTDSGTLLKSVPITNNAGSLNAVWNGIGKDGKVVAEGYYRLYPSDLTGNRSTAYSLVFVVNSEFKVTAATQRTTKSCELEFNQNIDETSVSGAVVTFDPSGPAVTSITLSDSKKLLVLLSDALTDSVNYKVSVTSDSVWNTDGITLSQGKNSASFNADVKGPSISEIGFTGITNSRDFIVHFSEIVTQTTAENLGNYNLTLASRRISLTTSFWRSDSKSVMLTASENLLSTQTYKITAVGIADSFGSLSSGASAERTFKGIDLAPPKINLAAFSNPSVESDIVIAATVNEELKSTPVCIVLRGGSEISRKEMTPGIKNGSWMSGTNLDPSLSGVVTIRVEATDQAGNKGVEELSFSTAMISMSVRASVNSSDKILSAVFPKGSLKKDTSVRIIPQTLLSESDIESNIETKTSAKKRANKLSENENLTSASMRFLSERLSRNVLTSIQANELVPVGTAYEITFTEKNLVASYSLNISCSAASSQLSTSRNSASVKKQKSSETLSEAAEGKAQKGNVLEGKEHEWKSQEAISKRVTPDNLKNVSVLDATGNIGLYYLSSDNSWRWVNSDLNANADAIAASVTTSGIFALMRDTKAPEVVIASLSERETSEERPVFTGKVSDSGSGIDVQNIYAVLDGYSSPVRSTSDDGCFEFVPLAPLCSGKHELIFKASDRAGNISVSQEIRFSVTPEFKIGDIAAFPNPAREKSTFRISTNRGDISPDLIEIALYDSSGHKVRQLDFARLSSERYAAASRYLYEIPWDLRNEDGRKVANGVYFAKIKIPDPSNPEKTIRRTTKIAILK